MMTPSYSLQNPSTINPTRYFLIEGSKKEKINKLADKIEFCPHLDWKHLVCMNCGTFAKKKIVKITCMSPFCKDSNCIINRRNLILKYFNSFHLKSKNFIHLIFGFPHVVRYDKKVRLDHQNTFRKFARYMKDLGTPLRLIKVRDVTGKKNDLYVHYHCLQLPVKNIHLFSKNLVIARKKLITQSRNKDFGFTIRNVGYRSKGALFDYFAKRLCGQFGDVKNNEGYGYPDLMNLVTYYSTFFNTKAVSLIGLRKRSAFSYVPLMVDNSPKRCENCGEMALRVIPESLFPFKPLREVIT